MHRVPEKSTSIRRSMRRESTRRARSPTNGPSVRRESCLSRPPNLSERAMEGRENENRGTASGRGSASSKDRNDRSGRVECRCRQDECDPNARPRRRRVAPALQSLDLSSDNRPRDARPTAREPSMSRRDRIDAGIPPAIGSPPSGILRCGRFRRPPRYWFPAPQPVRQ
jgi:hypothetical protein